MSQHRFGIVGAGMIASFQARALGDLPNAKLVGFCDMIEASARRAGEEFGAEWTTDFDAFIARDDIDIISICTPSGAHMDCALPAAKAGKHVIVEKPLEVTLEKCDAIIDACREAGVKLAVIFPTRFSDSAEALKKAAETGRFGTLALGDAYVKWWRDQDYYDKGGWRGTIALDGGGALMNQSIHAVDFIQWIMGPVDSITAATAVLAHERIEVEDTAVATVRYKNGALGVIEGSTAVYPGFTKKIEISGNRGSVVLEEEVIKVWQFDEETPADEEVRQNLGEQSDSIGGAADPSAISYEGHTRQFADFMKALDEDREPLVNGEEARKAVEIILAIYRAAETGGTVKLPL